MDISGLGGHRYCKLSLRNCLELRIPQSVLLIARLLHIHGIVLPHHPFLYGMWLGHAFCSSGVLEVVAMVFIRCICLSSGPVCDKVAKKKFEKDLTEDVQVIGEWGAVHTHTNRQGP